MASVRMIRSDDLLNQLTGLVMTNSCDIGTLAVVAQVAGIGEEFRAWLREQQPGSVRVTVESCLILEVSDNNG